MQLELTDCLSRCQTVYAQNLDSVLVNALGSVRACTLARLRCEHMTSVNISVVTLPLHISQIHFWEWKRRTSKLEPLHYVQSFDDIEYSWDRLFAQVGHRLI